jgi:CBS-domain-containing membrane protein
MKIAACMTPAVHSIRPEASLSEAASLLWTRDLGVLPVVDEQGLLRGMLTDRDICMAAFTSGRALHQLVVANHMASKVFALMPKDSLATAEKRMAMHQLRRLPVVDEEGKLVGLLSLADLSRSRLNGARIKALLAKISAPRSMRSSPASRSPSSKSPAWAATSNGKRVASQPILGKFERLWRNILPGPLRASRPIE